jgi:hypothetical protein
MVHVSVEDESIHWNVDDEEYKREDEKPEEAGFGIFRGRGVKDSVELTAVLVEACHDKNFEKLVTF